KDPPAFARTIALFRYEFPVDRLIQALKYGHQLALAAWLGHRLGERLVAENYDLLLPLPLHPSRLRTRGFNQSLEIARVTSKALAIPMNPAILTRIRATPPQAELPLKERGRNVRGAFECARDLAGKRILLVDDVMTTGSTLREAARILKLHGAGQITVAVAARALRH
ncbi:MAG: ComF family protein, partial [Azonexus sp.]